MKLPIKSNEIKPVLTLIFFYAIGNFLLLLNRGIYWDSWVWIPLIKAKDYSLIWNLLNDAKRFTAYYIFRLSGLTADPILFMKLAAFFSWLLASLFLYGMLRKKLSLRKDKAFFLSSFFALTPIFLVRVEPSILQHSINLMLFFMATFIYCLAEKNKNKLVAILNFGLSWILFFLSFHTYSLLMFYGGFLLLLFLSYRQENPKPPLKSLWRPWLKNNFHFLILPIIFWSFKILLWQPKGDWAGYDQFLNPFVSLSFTTLLFWETIVYGFFWPIIAPILILHRKIFFLIFLISVLIVRLTTKKISSEGKDFGPKYYLMAGGLLFFLGFLPYFLTGKVPHIIGNPFNMRTALLLPVGSSLIILGAILLIIKNEWQAFIQKIILALFMTFAIYNYYGLDMDWYKQRAVMESLKVARNNNLTQASTLIFHDHINSLNWLNREIHGEEYLGYLQEIYKNNPKFASAEGEPIISKQDIKKIIVARPYPESFDPLKKIVDVNIATYDGPEILTVGNWLKIKKVELFGDQQSLADKISEIFRIKLEINSE